MTPITTLYEELLKEKLVNCKSSAVKMILTIMVTIKVKAQYYDKSVITINDIFSSLKGEQNVYKKCGII